MESVSYRFKQDYSRTKNCRPPSYFEWREERHTVNKDHEREHFEPNFDLIEFPAPSQGFF